MGDIDVKTQADAARHYTSLRRRYWQLYLGGWALFAVLGTPLLASGERLNPLVQDILAIPLALGSLTCWVGAVFTWFALKRFRCPRCGERFVLSWSSTSSWPTAACKQCDLYLG